MTKMFHNKTKKTKKKQKKQKKTKKNKKQKSNATTFILLKKIMCRVPSPK